MRQLSIVLARFRDQELHHAILEILIYIATACLTIAMGYLCLTKSPWFLLLSIPLFMIIVSIGFAVDEDRYRRLKISNINMLNDLITIRKEFYLLRMKHEKLLKTKYTKTI